LQGAIVSALCWLGFGIAHRFTPERVPSLRSRDVTETTPRTETRLQAAESAQVAPPLAAAVTLPVNVPVPDPTPAAPVLSTTSDLTEIFVPVRGPVPGLSVAQWIDPPVVVVDLPSGELALSQTRYELGAGGVASLRVGRTRGVTQLRVYLTEVLSRFAAVPARGGIVIRLKRDLQSLPH
jgi:hypothetical protein